MRSQKEAVRDLQIAYIGGGSRGWAWTFMGDLALEPRLAGTIRLYDIDREAAEHNAVIGNRYSALPGAVGEVGIPRRRFPAGSAHRRRLCGDLHPARHV